MEQKAHFLTELFKLAKDTRKRLLVVRIDERKNAVDQSFWIHPDEPENRWITQDDYRLPFFVLKEVEMSGAV